MTANPRSERVVPDAVTEPDGRREAMLTAVFVAVLGVAVFARASAFGFVYDDRWTIVQNRWLDLPLRTLLAAMQGGTAPAIGIPDATRPAMVMSMWLDRRLFGASPVGYHLHSLVLYGATCAAAALTAFHLVEGRTARRVASAFFALAPIHTEVACGINYREDMIATLGILIPMAWLFRPSKTKDGIWAGAAISATFAWGLLGKESTMVLLPLVAAVALVSGAGRDWLEARERTLWFLLATLILWLNWRLALTIGVDGIPRAPATDLSTRVGDTARYEFHALADAVAPLNPSPEYDQQAHASLYWLLGILGLLAATWQLARKPPTRSLALGISFALVAPLFSSPLIGPANPWADRYVFVGVLGGGMVAGGLAAWLAPRAPRPWWVTACLLGVLALAWRSARTALAWQDERSLWTHAVERAPRSARAWAALSRVERLAGRLDEADRLLERAYRVGPKYVPARVTGVYNLLARGRVSAARDEIAAIERLGGPIHPGLDRARVCAAGSPEEAKRCASGG